MAALFLSLVLALAPATAQPFTQPIGGANGVDQSDFQMPFPCGEVWGASTHSNHPAVDWNGVDAASGPGDHGKPVLAGLGGTVEAVGTQSGYGNRVIVDHGDGWSSLYGHLSAISVTAGDRVSATSMVGTVGSTGTSSGPHLHWEQRYIGQRVPVLWADGSPVAVSYGSPGPTRVSNNCADGEAPAVSPLEIQVRAAVVQTWVLPQACAPGGGCSYG